MDCLDSCCWRKGDTVGSLQCQGASDKEILAALEKRDGRKYKVVKTEIPNDLGEPFSTMTITNYVPTTLGRVSWDHFKRFVDSAESYKK